MTTSLNTSSASLRKSASPESSAADTAAAASATFSSVASSASRARSKALNGRALDEGTRSSPTFIVSDIKPNVLKVVLNPKADKELDFPPTMPSAYFSGPTTQSSQSFFGVKASPSMYWPVGGPATEAAAATPSSEAETTSSSPTTSILTPSPFLVMRSAQPPGSGIAASRTPVWRARMAMCDNRSTGDAVSTAVTPGGMSSRPPRRALSTTTGSAL